VKEKKLPVYYEDVLLKKYFKADYICYDAIILELKAIKFLTQSDYTQTLNNIKATNFLLGILINFGEHSLKYHRLVNTYKSII